MTVTWTTNKPTIGFAVAGSNNQVATFGNYQFISQIESGYGTSHSATISVPATVASLHFTAVAKDMAGNTVHALDQMVPAGGAPPPPPPPPSGGLSLDGPIHAGRRRWNGVLTMPMDRQSRPHGDSVPNSSGNHRAAGLCLPAVQWCWDSREGVITFPELRAFTTFAYAGSDLHVEGYGPAIMARLRSFPAAYSGNRVGRVPPYIPSQRIQRSATGCYDRWAGRGAARCSGY